MTARPADSPRPDGPSRDSGQAPSRARAAGDARLDALRYRIDGEAPPADAPIDNRTAAEMRAWARTAIDLAIARGDFDDLPGAGKPLPNLAGDTVDPDWWIRGLIERENLTGLAPPALSLRSENQQLDAALDALHTEKAVRAHLDDFNARITEARRQLSGGPPVVTPLRDVDAEVSRWEARRVERRAAAAAAADAPRPSWRERRRARRRQTPPATPTM
ncbi:DUF1992 domain-containing protein [Frigoribacterium sp. 2-23]|uniref:DnaJ family domain-containing protein n=1 Tax=Frigoribacterium sp. 2-23 TaxID=3415006 RepID=UPI003C6EA4D5